jgi:hypothetical protein
LLLPLSLLVILTLSEAEGEESPHWPLLLLVLALKPSAASRQAPCFAKLSLEQQKVGSRPLISSAISAGTITAPY